MVVSMSRSWSCTGPNPLPAIVYIVLVQATHRLAEGTIARGIFEEQIRRITREELEPRGLTLLTRDLTGGRMRYLIKEKSTGLVREMMDFGSDGTLERQDYNTALSASQDN